MNQQPNLLPRPNQMTSPINNLSSKVSNVAQKLNQDLTTDPCNQFGNRVWQQSLPVSLGDWTTSQTFPATCLGVEALSADMPLGEGALGRTRQTAGPETGGAVLRSLLHDHGPVGLRWSGVGGPVWGDEGHQVRYSPARFGLKKRAAQ